MKGCSIAALVMSGNMLAATLNVPAQHATVQAAVNAAQPGDTVLLAAGVYVEEVDSVRSGTEDNRITIDGQGVATIKRFSAEHDYLTLKNLTITGVTTFFDSCLWIERGADYGVVQDCVIDVAHAWKVRGVTWNVPTTKPLGLEAGNNWTFQRTTVRRVKGAPCFIVFGNNHLFEYIKSDSNYEIDFYHLFGQNHVIRYNHLKDNVEDPDPDNSNHPDCLQTFGNNGYGSKNMLFEYNIVENCPGAQITQLEGNLIPQISDWIIRNNVFVDFGLGSSCSIPNMTIENNTFLRCGTGHAMYYSSRGYTGGISGDPDLDIASIDSSSPSFAEANGDKTTLQAGKMYEVSCRPKTSGNLVNGTTYKVSGGTVRYDGADYTSGTTFTANETTTFANISGSPIVRPDGSITFDGITYYHGQRLTAGSTGSYTETYGSDTYVFVRLHNEANNVTIKNNAFFDCGDGANTRGWYGWDLQPYLVSGRAADYNFVAKGDYTTKREPVPLVTVDDPSYNPQYWYELNGINGGNPLFANINNVVGPDNIVFTEDDGLQLQAGSPLLGAGEGGADIGAYGEGAPAVTRNISAGTVNADAVTIQ